MLKWKRVANGYEAKNLETSSFFQIVRLIRRGNVVVFELYVEGEVYGGEGKLSDKKDVANTLLTIRQSRRSNMVS